MRPSFFIVGAPKCGTTALSSYLSDHPELFMCSPKEPYYFASDLGGLPRISSLTEYLSLFKGAPEQAKVAGESSAVYAFSSVAIENIAAFDAAARIVFMVRNPVDIAHAFHSELLYDASEDERSFEAAWRLQESRHRGEGIPRLCREPQLLQYRRVALVGAQAARLLSIFPRSQVKFILNEDLAESPRAVYGEVLSFLGLRDDEREDFPRVNESKQTRSRSLGVALSRPPSAISSVARWTRQVLGMRGGFLDPIRRLNRRRVGRDELGPAFREELVAEFREDVSKLERIVERSLSHWT